LRRAGATSGSTGIRARGRVTALLLLSPLAGAREARQELPFEPLGTAFLAEVESRAPAPSSARLAAEAVFIELLGALHHRVDLGGMQIWIPRRAQSQDGSFGGGFDPRDARPWARELIELERVWFDHLDLTGDVRAERLAALARVAEHVESLGTGEIPPADAELAAARLLLASTFPHPTAARAPILIIAPARAHLVGLFGAAGLAVPGQRQRLWNDGLRRNAFAWLFFEVLVIPLDEPLADEAPSLVAARNEQALILETIVHRGSHLLSERVIPAAPDWFIEGLALHDTIVLTGDDDSLCTGFSQRERIRGGAAAFEWIDANMSPYREGAATRWFDKQLRPDDDGWFAIHDLDRGGPGLRLPGPFLGQRAVIPDTVRDGPAGLQRGYAEFFRAYCAAFVHWLSLERVGDRSVLRWLIRFMRDPQRLRALSEPELAPVGLRMITMKTLGESDDPERDLEAAFAVWLAER